MSQSSERQKPLHLMVRLDAVAATGLGHAVRTAGILAEIPIPLELTVVGEGEALASFFPRARILSSGGLGLAALAAQHGADALMVDLPNYENTLWTRDVAGDRPLIVIDDWGGPLKADLIINGTVLDAYHRYPRMHAGVLSGAKYALVRPAFGQTPWTDTVAASVVVVAGSGTRAQDWVQMLAGDHVDRTAWGRLTVIVGNTFADIDSLRRGCAEIGAALEAGVSAPALAKHLAEARVALVTGGMVVYEAMAVGVPAVVFPQLENLVPEAAWLADQGCICDLGFDGGMNPGAVASAVSRLITNRPLAKDMSSRAHGMIDGQGMVRAAQAITRLLRASDF